MRAADSESGSARPADSSGSGSTRPAESSGGGPTAPAPKPDGARPATADASKDKTARPATSKDRPANTVADTADPADSADDADDPTKNGPGMRPTKGAAAPTNGTVTLGDDNRAVQRRDGKACRAALAKLVTPPPTDFRVASAHAVCEMVAGDCEGGKRESRALAIREGGSPSSVDTTADLYCSVNDPDPAVRLRRLTQQLSLFTWFECSYYLPAARASGKVVANDRERMAVGSALARIAKCYSDHDDCPTGLKVLGEAQAFIPKLGVSELNAACR